MAESRKLVEPDRLVQPHLRHPPHRTVDLDLQARLQIETAWEAFRATLDVEPGSDDDKLLGYVTVETWQERQRPFIQAVEKEKVLVTILFGVVSVVAIVLIGCIFYMVVEKKTRDIGIMKSMGATPRSILRIFVFEGLVIGALGTVLGAASGYLLATLLDRYQFVTLPSDVYPVETIPVEMQGLDFIFVAVAAMVIAFIAAIYPAWQASRLEPVEAIRRE